MRGTTKVDMVIKWAARFYIVWTVLAVMYFFLHGTMLLGPKLEVQMSQIKETSGKGYRFKPTTAQAPNADQWSAARLYEDGKELSPRVVSQAPVIQRGAGAYHFSGRNLWFSATDDSDPRTNHKRYVVALPLWLPSAPTALLRIWSWSLIILVIFAGRHRIAAGWKTLAGSRLWQVALLAVIVRIILISHDEIVATVADQEEYMVLAKGWYYQVPPDRYFRLPVYPLFVALVNTTGLPLRLVIEAVQIASYALLARALISCGFSRWVACVTFVWMTLSYWTADWNNYSITETLYVAVLIAALSHGLLWLSTRVQKHGIYCGLLLALLMNLREERIVGAAMGGMLLAFMVVQLWRGASTLIQRSKIAVLALAPMTLTWAALDVTFQAAFYARTGAAAHCLLSTPGMVAFMESLYRIPPQGPPRRCYWLDEKLRNYASTLSPTFREWQHFFENEKIGFHERAERVTGVRDLTPDAFVFTIMWNGISDGDQPMELPERERLMKQIAAEIRQGLAGHEQQKIYMRGTYTVNSSVLTMWWSEIQPLLMNSLQWSFNPLMNGPYPRVGPTSDSTVALFDSLTHRREGFAKIMDTSGDPRPAWIKAGWMFVEKVSLACLWFALGLALMLPIAAACTRAGRTRIKENLSLLAIIALLQMMMIILSRLALGTLVPLYFIDTFQRYMIIVPLVALPFLLLVIDVATRKGERSSIPTK